MLHLFLALTQNVSGKTYVTTVPVSSDTTRLLSECLKLHKHKSSNLVNTTEYVKAVETDMPCHDTDVCIDSEEELTVLSSSSAAEILSPSYGGILPYAV